MWLTPKLCNPQSLDFSIKTLEPVCCKKQQKKFLTSAVTGLRNRGPLKDLNDSKLIVYESKPQPIYNPITAIGF